MDFKELTASQLTKGMGAGWNLGNTMDAIVNDRSKTYPTHQKETEGTPGWHETAWGNPVTTPEMIRLVSDAGFKTLRIPITWEAHLGAAPEYKIDKAWLDRVQELVDYGFDNGLYVIINMHHEDWHFPSYENYDKAEGILVAVWSQIAERFRDYSEKLLFESLNEPRTKRTEHEWTGGNAEARDVINKWNAAFVKVVRASGGNNAKRWLLVPTIAASGGDVAMADFVMPDDDRTIVSVHAYTPHDFAINTQALDNKEFEPDNPKHTEEIDSLFKRIDDYFISKGFTVIMGETGCLNKDNHEARINWARYYTEAAASRGVPCIWWDNGISKAVDGGEGFGVMNRMDTTWWYPEIIKAFIDSYL